MKHKTILLILGVAWFLLIGSTAQPRQPSEQPAFDAHRLKTGTFLYRDFEGDKDIGKSQITIEEIHGSGDFRFSNVVSGKFSQRWEAVMTSTFDPMSASLSFGEGAGVPAFDLNYSAGRVTGFVVDRKGPTAGSKRPVNDIVPPAIIDQRVDWAAVSASDLKSGRSFEFSVYDPAIGISHVLARNGPAESVRVPAGEFEACRITYEINKHTGVERYQVLVTRHEPRLLIREEFPNGSASDLVAIGTSTQGKASP